MRIFPYGFSFLFGWENPNGIHLQHSRQFSQSEDLCKCSCLGRELAYTYTHLSLQKYFRDAYIYSYIYTAICASHREWQQQHAVVTLLYEHLSQTYRTGLACKWSARDYSEFVRLWFRFITDDRLFIWSCFCLAYRTYGNYAHRIDESRVRATCPQSVGRALCVLLENHYLYLTHIWHWEDGEFMG